MFGSCYSATLPRTCLRACLRASLDTSANNRRKRRSKISQQVGAVYFWDILTALQYTRFIRDYWSTHLYVFVGVGITAKSCKEAFAQGMDEDYLQFLKRKRWGHCCFAATESITRAGLVKKVWWKQQWVTFANFRCSSWSTICTQSMLLGCTITLKDAGVLFVLMRRHGIGPKSSGLWDWRLISIGY